MNAMTSLEHHRLGQACGHADAGDAAALAAMRAEIADGLSATPKRLPSKFFYDEEGSRLFELICEQPEYDLTRNELAIMQAHAPSIAQALGPGVRLVEFGSGNGIKTRLLLGALDAPAAYVPVEISPTALGASVDALQRDFPRLPIVPLVADFTRRLELPRVPARRTVVFFPGSTLGNFAPDDALALLRSIRVDVGPRGAALVGIDLRKDAAEHEAAYNDRAGVTARFTLNMLAHLNRRAGTDFDLDAFTHEARYDAQAGRIATHLVTGRDQAVTLGARRFAFARGERLLVEYSHKYTLAGFEHLARQANLRVARTWTDPRERFAVVLLESTPGPRA